MHLFIYLHFPKLLLKIDNMKSVEDHEICIFGVHPAIVLRLRGGGNCHLRLIIIKCLGIPQYKNHNVKNAKSYHC